LQLASGGGIRNRSGKRGEAARTEMRGHRSWHSFVFLWSMRSGQCSNTDDMEDAALRVLSDDDV
jgi:hypothetical protein